MLYMLKDSKVSKNASHSSGGQKFPARFWLVVIERHRITNSSDHFFLPNCKSRLKCVLRIQAEEQPLHLYRSLSFGFRHNMYPWSGLIWVKDTYALCFMPLMMNNRLWFQKRTRKNREVQVTFVGAEKFVKATLHLSTKVLWCIIIGFLLFAH